MPLRTIVTFAIAIMLGLFSVLLVRNYLSSTKNDGEISSARGGAMVVVAARPIERGQKLAPGLLKVVRVPMNAAPAGAFTAVEPLVGGAGGDRVALRAVALNEPILPNTVSGPGGRAILSTSVAAGMRAVSLRSNDVAGVAGFVLPGDHVDVLLTRDTGKGDNAVVTQLLADNVLVLGVDQTNDDQAKTPQVAKAVTVQVSPDQAQTIALAHEVGTVSLALRGVADTGAPMRRATTVADLSINGARPAADAPRVAKPAAHVRTAWSRPAPQMSSSKTVHVTRGVEVAGYEVAAR